MTREARVIEEESCFCPVRLMTSVRLQVSLEFRAVFGAGDEACPHRPTCPTRGPHRHPVVQQPFREAACHFLSLPAFPTCTPALSHVINMGPGLDLSPVPRHTHAGAQRRLACGALLWQASCHLCSVTLGPCPSLDDSFSHPGLSPQPPPRPSPLDQHCCVADILVCAVQCGMFKHIRRLFPLGGSSTHESGLSHMSPDVPRFPRGGSVAPVGLCEAALCAHCLCLCALHITACPSAFPIAHESCES